MALSPFQARLALAAFLAIAGGVAANLLVMQSRHPAPAQARSGSARGSLATDGERLRRLVEDAVGADTQKPVAPAILNAPQPPRRPAERLGGFSPSSAELVRAAMPDVDPLEARKATIRAVQTELTQRGYSPGAADGATGLVTRAAVLAYEYDQGLPLTADPSPEVLAHLRHGSSAPGMAIGLNGEATPAAGQAEAVISWVQQALHQLGYLGRKPDGQNNEETIRAIREFEMDTGMIPTGRVSAPLVVRLAKRANIKVSG
jgi:peptidoglycan hydrolase-like protein with peptidoglycan-binding domain